MNLQQPARSTPSMGFGDKIDIWIEKQLRFSPVNGDEHSHLHFEGLRPGPEWDAGEVARSAHLLGELTGLALRGATTCPMELNLRPRSVSRRHEMERRRPFFVLAAACFVIRRGNRQRFDQRGQSL